MASKRFQIYLSPEQHLKIRSISRNRSITMAEVIRQAIDVYLDDSAPVDPVSRDPIWSIVGIADGCLDRKPPTGEQ